MLRFAVRWIQRATDLHHSPLGRRRNSGGAKRTRRWDLDPARATLPYSLRGWWKIWTRPWMRTPVPRSLRKPGSASIKLGLQAAEFSEAGHSPPFLPNLPSLPIHPSPSRTRAAHALSVPWPSPSFFRNPRCWLHTEGQRDPQTHSRLTFSRSKSRLQLCNYEIMILQHQMVSYCQGGAKCPPRLKVDSGNWPETCSSSSFVPSIAGVILRQPSTLTWLSLLSTLTCSSVFGR